MKHILCLISGALIGLILYIGSLWIDKPMIVPKKYKLTRVSLVVSGEIEKEDTVMTSNPPRVLSEFIRHSNGNIVNPKTGIKKNGEIYYWIDRENLDIFICIEVDGREENLDTRK